MNPITIEEGVLVTADLDALEEDGIAVVFEGDDEEYDDEEEEDDGEDDEEDMPPRRRKRKGKDDGEDDGEDDEEDDEEGDEEDDYEEGVMVIADLDELHEMGIPVYEEDDPRLGDLGLEEAMRSFKARGFGGFDRLANQRKKARKKVRMQANESRSEHWRAEARERMNDLGLTEFAMVKTPGAGLSTMSMKDRQRTRLQQKKMVRMAPPAARAGMKARMGKEWSNL